MRLRMCAAITVIMLAAGCGSAKTADGDPEDTPTTAATQPTAATPTGTAPDEPAPITFEVAPGRVGAAHAGMTKAQAAATGYFDTDVTVGGDICSRVEPLQWKKQYQDALDVFTTKAGVIASMGIRGPIRTTRSVGVGNTLGEINAAYGDAVSPAVEAGYDQTGVYVTAGDDWLGFLVDETFTKVSPSSKVTFMEVTKGARPDLMRDGC